MTRRPAPCGTLSARDRHVKHGEDIDPACAAEWLAYQRAYREARRILRDRYPAEWETALARAVAARRPKPWQTASSDLARERNAEFLALVADQRKTAGRTA